MPEIAIFVEDAAHEAFITALIDRIRRECQSDVTLYWGNARRGHGAVTREVAQYVRDLQRGRARLPDALVVATDANCKGLNARRKDLESALRGYPSRIIYAIPTPHIERWLLIDSRAFKSVLGRGCNAPDQKCERDRYKDQLTQAIVDAGVVPTLGGIEYTAEIVESLDLSACASAHDDFGTFYYELRSAICG